MPGLISIARLLAEIDENPIEGAKTAQKRYSDGVRNATYESSVSAGALYRKLKHEKALCGAFYSLPFWEGGNARDAKHLNKHCHQFVYGARDGSEGKRAEDHAFATQSYYDDESRTLEEILDALKKGGFDSFKKAKSAQETRARLKEMDASERRKSSGEGKTKGIGSNDSDDAQTDTSPGGDEPPAPRYPKLTMKEVFEHLLVAMELGELALFRDGMSEVGDVYQITVQRDADNAKGMFVWRAIDILKEGMDA